MAGTVRKHHPRGQDKYLAVLREGQAKLEWETQQNNLKELKEKLLSLPLEARLSLFRQFCTSCGIDDPSCRCWDDDCRCWDDE